MNQKTSLLAVTVLLALNVRCLADEFSSLNAKDLPTLNAAVSALGSDVGTLAITTATKVTSSVTIGKNITLAFAKGGYLDVDPGVDVIIEGPIDAVPRNIFAGGGRIRFGRGRVVELYPQWWGAAGDGEHDDTSAIQRMTVAAAEAEMLCRFPSGLYRTTDTITIEASHGMQWRMPPGTFIDAHHKDPKRPYALLLKNCIHVDLDVNIRVNHPGQCGLNVHGETRRNSLYNKVRGLLQGPGRSSRKPPPAGGSMGLRLSMDGHTNFFNDFNLRIFAFDSCISLQDGCNANRFLNPQLEKFWYGIELSSDENCVLGGFCHFAAGTDDDIVDCVHVGYHANDKEDAAASYNQVLGLTCETGPRSRALNIRNGGANVFMIQNNNPEGDIIKRPDHHIFLKDRSYTVSREITDGLRISTRATSGTPIALHLSQKSRMSFPKPAAVPGSQNLTIPVKGAAVGDTVVFAPGNPVPDNVQITAWVDGADTVKVRLVQFAGDPASFDAGTCRVDVWKHQ